MNNVISKRIILFLLFTVFSVYPIFCGKVIIKGKAPSYTRDHITFYSFQNYFDYAKKNWCTVAVDDSGYFEYSFKIEETYKIFADIGIYNAFFYAEPGRIYNLVLPEKVEKEMKNKLNPYFEPVEVHLGIKGAKADELNLLIRMFNDAYVPYFNKHVVNVVTNKDFSKLDEDIKNFIKPFEGSENPYFKEYIKYRVELIRFLAMQNKSKGISDEFFNHEPIHYNNPAYMELFNQVYDQYFMFFGRTESGKQIYEDIGKYKSYALLNKTLANNKILSDENLRELVILKNIYDEFYSSNFSRNALLNILDTLIVKTNNTIHKEISINIKKQITFLMAGYYPPDFELYNQDSVLVKLSDLKGKYIYLNFCTSQSYTCIQEYEALKYIYNKHKDRLEIITISIDASFEAMSKSKKQINCPWTFLHFGNQPEVINDYDVRAFPTYYLIDKEGKLVRSPAPSPSENLEKTLFDIMRERGDI